MSGREMWLAEIQSKKGLIPADFVSELHILCEPKHVLEEPINIEPDQADSVFHDHTENEDIEPVQDHSAASEFHSDIPPIHPSSQSESTYFQPTDTIPLHQRSSIETHHVHEQNTEYTITADQSSETLSENGQQHQETHQQPVSSSTAYAEISSDITPDQLVQSTPLQDPDEVTGSNNVIELHVKGMEREDHLTGSHEMHDSNSKQDEESNFSDIHGSTDKEYTVLGVAGDDTQSASTQGDNGDVEDETQVQSVKQSDHVHITDPIPSDEYTDPMLSSAHVNAEASHVHSETAQIQGSNEEQVETTPSSAHFDDNNGHPSMQPQEDSHTPSEQPNEVYHEALNSQDMTEGNTHGQDSLTDHPQITDQDVNMQSLGNADTLMGVEYDNSPVTSDNDYVLEATNDTEEGFRNDIDPNPADAVSQMETYDDAQGYPSEGSDEGLSYGGQGSGHVWSSAESDLKVPVPSASLSHPAMDHAGDQNGQHRDYLDVKSLRQRYLHRRSSESSEPDETLDPDLDSFETETVPPQYPSPEIPHQHTTSIDHDVVTATPFLSPEVEEEVFPDEMKYYPPPSPEGDEMFYEGLEDTGVLSSQTEQWTDPVDTDGVEGTQLPSPETSQQTMHSMSHSEPDLTNDIFYNDGAEPLTPVLSTDTESINVITEFLPSPLASWLIEQGSEVGIIGISVSILAVVVPLCCSCCHFWKDSRRKAMTISKQTASRRALEEQVKKLKSEKTAVHSELRLLEERYGSLEHELEQVQERNHILTEAKADLEANCESVSGEMASLQQELILRNSQVDQLRSELKHEQLQLSAQTNDKEVALQQIALLRDQIKEYEQNVRELEAAKDQLEQDAFSTHNSLQQLEKLHTQVSQQLADSASECTQLKSELHCIQEEVSSLQQAKSENEQEIQTMQDCLSKLITSTDAVASEMDGQDDEGSGTNAEKGTNDTLSKIQEMLNTTKVRARLQAVTEENDKVATMLEEQTALVKELQVKNSSLSHHIKGLESQMSESSAKFQKLEEKHKTLTEYFEQKEHSLHRKLGAEEAVRLAVENREAQVKEKADSLEQAETRHKEELKQLRNEMFEIEKSLVSQVHSCQKRAEEAIAEQRRLEQECKALKLEREDMRKRSLAVGRPTSAGPLAERQPVLTGHPAYHPRTSSPGAVDSQDHDEIPLLNQTDPLPTSHPPTQILNSGDPNYSLRNAADFKVPLRYVYGFG
jgi:predicted  nucleic acid-binding Zn-ribbon protein